MKKTIFYIAVIFCVTLFSSCLKNAVPLNTVPSTLVWNDSSLIDAYTVNVYSNMLFLYNSGCALNNSYSEYSNNFMGDLSDESTSGFSWLWLYYFFKPGNWNYGLFDFYALNTPWQLWGYYSTILQQNQFLQNIQGSTLPAQSVQLRTARMRWSRAFTYFILARNYGGVPLITQPQTATEPHDSLYPARNTESQIYQFCLSELNDIITNNELPAVSYDNGNPTLYEALALESQIALYAGNIAQYGTLELNGIDGVPSSMATSLYQTAYNASQQIINSGVFSLYNGVAGNYAANFQQLFLTKQAANPEVIYSVQLNGPVNGVGGSWDVWECPYGLEGGWPGNASQPYLEMAEEFEWINQPGVPGTFNLATLQQGEWTYDSLWKNKDPRFFATLYTHGTTYQGTTLQMNQFTITSNGTENIQGANYNTGAAINTGFGVLKYLNTSLVLPEFGQSNTDIIVHRLGGILLNYAEAAFYLGQTGNALTAVNRVRTRVGLQPLGNLTLQNIQHERKCELAFENGDRYYALKSWRLSASVLSQQYSGLVYTQDAITGNFKVTVLPAIDGDALSFPQEQYYLPLTTTVTLNNPNIVENPGYN